MQKALEGTVTRQVPDYYYYISADGFTSSLFYFDISRALGLLSMVLPCLHAAFSILSSFPHHLSSSLNPTQQRCKESGAKATGI